jgi:hypothetical protein
MHLCRKFAPLLSVVVGILALMIPTPGAGVAALAPLSPVVLVANVALVDNDNAAMIALREEARTAMLRLQAAGNP